MVWKQKLKMKPKAVYIENMRIPASKQLTLYYNPYSYCSQKVLIALHEKNLSFQSYIIDVTKSKQYDKWFLQISPNGEIPVLQDGNRIITYARNIINYLDEWHTTELNTELFPKDLETIKKATHFRNIIDEIPITILTVGSFIHKISIEDPKPPFTWSIIQYIINGEKQASTYVHQKAELYPEFRGSLLNKAVYLKGQHDQIVNFQEFKKIITDCDDVFDQIEAELSTNSVYKKEFWLINETFTTVDISLAVLLERIYNIGISKLFWGNGKRPNLAKYFQRVRKRKSFQKSMPTRLMNFQMMYGLKICLAYITGLTCTLGLMLSKCYK